MIIIGEVFPAAEVAELREAARRLPYEDGARTAGRVAQRVKRNEQAVRTPECEAILARVRDALFANPLFRAAAQPKAMAGMLISRYRPGMHYGTHVDDPVMHGRRVDLSFTLPLSDPADYEGGELVLEEAVEDRAFKPDAGDALLYPTGALHRVEPVKSGERIAVIGWLTSRVRDAVRREILFELDMLAASLLEDTGQSAIPDTLDKVRANLARLWYED